MFRVTNINIVDYAKKARMNPNIKHSICVDSVEPQVWRYEPQVCRYCGRLPIGDVQLLFVAKGARVFKVVQLIISFALKLFVHLFKFNTEV